jgi:electron transport complex protein RnfG
MDRTLFEEYEPKNQGFANSHLAQAWLVLLLVLVFGAALAAVQVNLSGVISRNRLNETLERVPELVSGKGSDVSVRAGGLTVQQGDTVRYYRLFLVSRKTAPAGWVVKAGGQGYADRIELLAGFDPSLETISGIFILDQKETPGLGNKITSAEWRSQFAGKKTGRPLAVVKTSSNAAHTIDAISGATISSRAVVTIVNRIAGDLRERLSEKAVTFDEEVQ